MSVLPTPSRTSNGYENVDGHEPSARPTPIEVEKKVRERSTRIFEDWKVLRAILERHEQVLRKRWTKKTRQQRTKILETVWPSMSPTHRPDLQAYWKESEQQRLDGTRYRQAYLWPYINVEELVKSKTLLLFLNARGRHTPDTFAHADLEAVQMGCRSRALRPAILLTHTMLFHGQTDAESYGRIVVWKGNHTASRALISGITLDPGMGLLVLEIQQGILHFLVQSCFQILHDMSPTHMIEASVAVQPEPPAVNKDEQEWPSVVSMASETPYRVPAHLDISRLQAIVAAKRSAAEDHIWALREDPGYFSDIVNEVGKNRIESLLDINGKQHPDYQTSHFWEFALRKVVINTYGSFILWNIVQERITTLASLIEEHSANISSERELPHDLRMAFNVLKHGLTQIASGPIVSLTHAVPTSPAFCCYFARASETLGTASDEVVPVRSYDKDPLARVLTSMVIEETAKICGLYELMDEYERIVQSDRKQKDRVTPFVANQLSDLAVVLEIRRQISLYHPMLSGAYNKNKEDTPEVTLELSKSIAHFPSFKHAIRSLEMASIGTPSSGRFYYPIEKRRTLRTTDAMRKAEMELDIFWLTVDQHFVQECGKSQHQAIQYLLPEHRSVQRTPEWVEPDDSSHGQRTEASPETAYIPLPHLNADLETPARNGPVVPDASPPKPRVKTRGPATSADLDNTPPPALEADAQTTPPRTLLPVSRRAFKVFASLFHNPLQPVQPGEVPWHDFLHAMAAAGFAPEKLYGSVWQFTPTTLDVARSIQFHEPHPGSKIPIAMARRLGRRLNRAYGWTGDMFVVAEKDAAVAR
ncbi:hypothetical protein MMC18_009026 [Xylographa bjoerkii]|nr:hypothetical protein [Xylographa bjoerkii]